MGKLFFTVAIALATMPVLPSCKPTAVTGASPAKKIIFFDDFSGNQLNRKNWNVEITGMHVNNELQAYVDSTETISFINGNDQGAVNGALLIKPKYSPGFVTADGKKFDFISGRINTAGKMDFAYGTASARIKLTAGTGLWPAWWRKGSRVRLWEGAILQRAGGVLDPVHDPRLVRASGRGTQST